MTYLRLSRFSRAIYPVFISIVALLNLAAATAVAQPLGQQDARFFLTRTGFTPQSSEVDHYAQLTRQQAGDQLLKQTTATAGTPAPVWTGQAMVSNRTIKNTAQRQKRALTE